jgi:glycosyltransferase involved in cell wall biosynthesis
MEALAMHRPVLSTQVAGIPELVRPGVCGWLISPGDLDSLCTAMARVLSTAPEELERMGDAGAQLVAERHDVSAEVARLGKLFHSQLAT